MDYSIESLSLANYISVPRFLNFVRIFVVELVRVVAQLGKLSFRAGINFGPDALRFGNLNCNTRNVDRKFARFQAESSLVIFRSEEIYSRSRYIGVLAGFWDKQEKLYKCLIIFRHNEIYGLVITGRGD